MSSNSIDLSPLKKGAQISLKLSTSTFFAWRRQVNSLLAGMKCIGYINGKTTPEPEFITTNGKSNVNPAYEDWFANDQLIVSFLLASMTERDAVAFSSCDTARQLWLAIEAKYADPSRAHVMSLKNQLQRSRKGSQTVTEFLFQIKRVADELAVLDATISDDDITLYVLNGLGSEYRDIAASIRTRDRSFTFEELHSHLIAHEEFLQKDDVPADVAVPTANFHQRNNTRNFRGRGNYRRGGRHGPVQNMNHTPTDSFNLMQSAPRHQNTSNNNSNRPNYQGPSRNQGHFNSRANRQHMRCQFCDFTGHIAKYCPQIMQSNPTAHYAAANPNWILDSGANHHITTDLNNLSLHSNYEGPDSVTIGDGSGSQDGVNVDVRSN
ncbi:hypothetical protein L195_g017041 [Trifolium pratense]|uniref:CCHC-type domain-containing protein n=1 Tax=Trifolium pratense TaxID=57577 RepID=A0A2K3MT42_TRIPR|nr:hypothetical protein L195_g017041 [Trifolium pratense]